MTEFGKPRGSSGGAPSLTQFGQVCKRCRSAIDGDDPSFCTACREVMDNKPKAPVGTVIIRETVIREVPTTNGPTWPDEGEGGE